MSTAGAPSTAPLSWHAALAGIDWLAPWFAAHADIGRAVAARCLDGLPLHTALQEAAHAPVVPVPDQALPAGQAYEQYIFETGRCPVREGLHDFFHGLAWHLFPATKLRMNALQASEMSRHGIGATRGALRDRLAVMDESGAFVCAPPPLWEALVAKDWQRVFGPLRPLWRDAQVWILGHALLEQLVHPRKNLTAHVWPLGTACSNAAEVDSRLADILWRSGTPPPAAHLPVLGVPGWCAANADPHFYDDRTVFRPPRATAPGLVAGVAPPATQ